MPTPFSRIRRGDLIAAVLLYAAGAVLIGLGSFEPYWSEAPLALRFAPPALVCLGVVFRRASPALCLSLGVAGFGTELAIGLTLVTACVFTDNIYAFARYGPRKALRPMTVTAVAAVLVFTVWAFLEIDDAGAVLSTAAIGAIILISPIGTAVIVRQAHDRARLEAERAEQQASLAEARRHEAVLRERTTMARELHDTVANYLSAIALQSTGLQARADLDEETLKRSVDAIRQSSVEGLAELRRIIGLLRSVDADEELAAYRLDQVPDLVERMRRVGLKVDFAVAGPERELPGQVETAAFRVVQEGLTNVLKHGSDASVRIDYGSERLTVTVENAVAAPAVSVPGGAGLVGMTERVRLLGGAVKAGPSGGAWRVRAEIPTEGTGE